MKRTWIAIGSAALGGTVIVAACAFPEVTFSAGDASPETSTPEAGDGGEDAPADVAVEAEKLDAAVTDAQMAIDAESCQPTTCDCDEDGFVDFNKRAACDAGTADAASLDCDDLVKGRNPNVKDFQTITTPTTDGGRPPVGDWNCDGKTELAFDTNLECIGTLGSCASSKSTKSPNGGASEGFVGNIGCGQSGPYYKCQAPTLGDCKAVLAENNKPQGCK